MDGNPDNPGKMKYLALVRVYLGSEPHIDEVLTTEPHLQSSDYRRMDGFQGFELIRFWELGKTTDNQVRRYTNISSDIRKLRKGKISDDDLPFKIPLTQREEEDYRSKESQES